MFDITPIIEAILGLLAAIITAIIVPYIKSCTTTEQQAQIDAWVKIGVTAAEQVFTGAGRGDEKKAYVIDFLKNTVISWMMKESTRSSNPLSLK